MAKISSLFRNILDVTRIVKEKRYKRIDILVTLALLILLIFSCIMVYSASMIGNTYGIFTGYVPVPANYFLIRQGIWAGASMLSYLIFALFVPYEIFKSKVLYSLGLWVILILLVIPRFSTPINGAYSWIRISGFTFQPSTLAQIFVIAYMALILNSRRETLMIPTSLKKITGIFAIPLTILLFIFIQNDTGTMLITASVLVLMILCANISFRNILTLIKLGVISAVTLMVFILIKNMFSDTEGASYRLNRFKVFLDPFNGVSDPNNQIVNSLIAFGNGGLFGRGLGNSIQKLGYLPEAHTDFILAITAEELGYVGVMFLMLLLFIIIIKIVHTGLRAPSTFEALFSIGFAGLIFIQTIINVGGVTASLPMTGVPIPFFSFGGSSMIVLCTALGIVVNLLSHIKYSKGGK